MEKYNPHRSTISFHMHALELIILKTNKLLINEKGNNIWQWQSYFPPITKISPSLPTNTSDSNTIYKWTR